MGLPVEERKWADIVSEITSELGSVLHSKEQLLHYSQSTTGDTRNIVCAIQPKSEDEIKEILLVAKKYKLKLYPVSTGNNWGYGSALPVEEHNVVLDLSKMNRILEVNETLGYVVIEPGVTQKQLSDYLRKHNINLRLNPTGAGPSTSIIGNILERGFTLGEHGNRFAACASISAILANGEQVSTSFGRFAKSKVTHSFKWGLGPYLDGLFTQSNFGIVTQMGVLLDPNPEVCEVMYISCDRTKIKPLIDSIRPLLLKKILPGGINVIDTTRVFTTKIQFPWSKSENKSPLSDQVLEELAEQYSVPHWSAVAPLFGTKEQVKAQKKVLRTRLKRFVDKQFFVSKPKLKMLNRAHQLKSMWGDVSLESTINSLTLSFELLEGYPNEISMKTPYWRNKSLTAPQQGIDPARDNCGLIWFAPVIPITGIDLVHLRRITEGVLRQFQFETAVTCTSLMDRNFMCTIPILFDKEDEEETSRAHQCYEKLKSTCIEQGYIPYRLGIQAMNTIDQHSNCENFNKLNQSIKNVLDPDHTIAPGRYGIS